MFPLSMYLMQIYFSCQRLSNPWVEQLFSQIVNFALNYGMISEKKRIMYYVRKKGLRQITFFEFDLFLHNSAAW